MIPIDGQLISRIALEAMQSPRKRKNYNFHREYADPLQRLLNIMEPFSYIQPHKHEDPDKVEAFVVLKGRLLVVEFHPHGEIAGYLLVDPALHCHGAEIPPRAFHTICALEPATVVYEVKNGPYDPVDDKNFAPWAPREGDPECRNYILSLYARCNIHP